MAGSLWGNWEALKWMVESLGSSCVTLDRLVGHDERQFCLSSHRAVALLGTLLSSGNVMVPEVSATVMLTAYRGVHTSGQAQSA